MINLKRSEIIPMGRVDNIVDLTQAFWMPGRCPFFLFGPSARCIF